MRAVVFPGQGSQFKSMGRDLFSRFPELVELADSSLGYSIADLCINDPDSKLGQTRYTQPAMYVVNALHFLASKETEDQAPDFVAGHSLGEYSALLAAEAFDFETGLRLVQKRANAMAEARNGGMAAVIGAEAADLRALLDRSDCAGLTIANRNTLLQNILSGPTEDLRRAEELIRDSGYTIVPLPVSCAFHSSAMSDAQAEFSEYLRTVEFNWLRTPVISNVEATPYSQSKIKSLLSLQITSPVRWLDTILYMRRNGASLIEEIGPGTVLRDMLAKIDRELKDAGQTNPAALAAAS